MFLSKVNSFLTFFLRNANIAITSFDSKRINIIYIYLRKSLHFPTFEQNISVYICKRRFLIFCPSFEYHFSRTSETCSTRVIKHALRKSEYLALSDEVTTTLHVRRAAYRKGLNENPTNADEQIDESLNFNLRSSCSSIIDYISDIITGSGHRAPKLLINIISDVKSR